MKLRKRDLWEAELEMKVLRCWEIKRWKTAKAVIPVIADPGKSGPPYRSHKKVRFAACKLKFS